MAEAVIQMTVFIRHAGQAKIPREQFHSGILVTSSRECRARVGRVGEDVTRMPQGCYEETAALEFRLQQSR